MTLTNHSLWPCNPSWLSRFTAITKPVPGLAAVKVCSSIHPLKTQPNPPSPNTLSGRKFLVAVLRSLKVKLFRLDDCNISPSVRGVWGTEKEEALLLASLESFPSPRLKKFTPAHVDFGSIYQTEQCTILPRTSERGASFFGTPTTLKFKVQIVHSREGHVYPRNLRDVSNCQSCGINFACYL